MKWFALWLFAATAVSLPTVGTLAHAFLDHAVPPVGGTVAASPHEIRLYFSEAIEPRFSGIELTSIDGRPVKTGPSTVDPRKFAADSLLEEAVSSEPVSERRIPC